MKAFESICETVAKYEYLNEWALELCGIEFSSCDDGLEADDNGDITAIYNSGDLIDFLSWKSITPSDFDEAITAAEKELSCGVTRAWKVYGADGHRQRESFGESYKYDFSTDEDGIRIIEVENSDKTGTNLYTIVRITRNTWGECEDEFKGQITDGIFENSRVGRIEEIKEA